ncbi:unnamed protein product [Cuscuta campestris]|uniref:DUF569 domain-containing protein n=1 Tax=Cuscuta campestris TaxID=132261 RepID=A0A484LBU3_9ASTE|nr:unnamed protein product [Cuscuta campestris]
MEHLEHAKVIRLKEYKTGKFLVANGDGKTLRRSSDGSSGNALWTVEMVAEGAQRYMRLKSCHGKYLTASNMPLVPRGRCQKVVQSLPEKLNSATEWEMEGEGVIRLKTRYGQFLKQYGGVMPWRHSLVHNDHAKRSALWEIQIVDGDEAAASAAGDLVHRHRRAVSDSTFSTRKAFSAVKFPNLGGIKEK